MQIEIKEAQVEDADFIVYANKMIDKASFIANSKLKENIYNDLFFEKKAECLIVKVDGKSAGMILFSKVYWADRGEGIYVSQAFVEEEFRNKGLFKMLLRSALDFYENSNFLTCLVAKKNENMNQCMKKLFFEDENMISYVKNKGDFDGIL